MIHCACDAFDDYHHTPRQVTARQHPKRTHTQYTPSTPTPSKPPRIRTRLLHHKPHRLLHLLTPPNPPLPTPSPLPTQHSPILIPPVLAQNNLQIPPLTRHPPLREIHRIARHSAQEIVLALRLADGGDEEGEVVVLGGERAQGVYVLEGGEGWGCGVGWD